MSKLFVIVFLASVAVSCAFRTTSLLELGARAHASMCQIASPTGAIEKWNCPFDNPTCCSYNAKSCCPSGYTCDETKTPVQCRKAASAASNVLNPSIQLASQSSVSSPSPAAVSSLLGQSPASSVASEASIPAAPETPASNSAEPKFRQNIIIVKNINVLTKGQQAPPLAPKSEDSAEESHHEESSHEASHHEESSYEASHHEESSHEASHHEESSSESASK